MKRLCRRSALVALALVSMPMGFLRAAEAPISLGSRRELFLDGLLIDRLEWFEPSGPVERLNSSVNGAVKHLPIRYRLT